MNTPTPTPRTDTEITFTGAYTHTCGELSCDECNARTATLTAERDELRAEAERSDAIYQRVCEVEHELRAEVKRMTHAYEYDHKCLYEVQDRCHLWKQRAQKA